MDKKTSNMSAVVKMDPPDLKGLQLLLQGSISTQVNQGIQEYSQFLKEPHVSSQPEQHIERLKEAYRYDGCYYRSTAKVSWIKKIL